MKQMKKGKVAPGIRSRSIPADKLPGEELVFGSHLEASPSRSLAQEKTVYFLAVVQASPRAERAFEIAKNKLVRYYNHNSHHILWTKAAFDQFCFESRTSRELDRMKIDLTEVYHDELHDCVPPLFRMDKGDSNVYLADTFNIVTPESAHKIFKAILVKVSDDKGKHDNSPFYHLREVLKKMLVNKKANVDRKKTIKFHRSEIVILEEMLANIEAQMIFFFGEESLSPILGPKYSKNQVARKRHTRAQTAKIIKEKREIGYCTSSHLQSIEGVKRIVNNKFYK